MAITEICIKCAATLPLLYHLSIPNARLPFCVTGKTITSTSSHLAAGTYSPSKFLFLILVIQLI